MNTRETTTRPLAQTAGFMWVAAAAIYLLTEAVAAAAFPGYSYATNYISDLGVTDVEVFDGRTINSPLNAVMNFGFIAQGVLLLAAALTAAHALEMTRRQAATLISVAALHAVGIILVAVFHGSTQAAQSGLIALHGVGAALAIICGNLTVIIGGVIIARRGLGVAYQAFSLAIAGLGLLALIGLETHTYVGFGMVPDGVWERGSVYSIIIWELVTGALLVRHARRTGTGTRRRSHP